MPAPRDRNFLRSSPDAYDVTRPEEIDARFEQLFLSLQPDERALLIEAIFQKQQVLQPSDAYKILILLTEAGAIDVNCPGFLGGCFV